MDTNQTSLPPVAPGTGQHTPTPWFVHEYAGKTHGTPLFSLGSDGYTFADGSHIAIAAHIGNGANAAFIVTAVNQHAALLSENAELRGALEAVLPFAYVDVTRGPAIDGWQSSVDRAEIALTPRATLSQPSP